MTGLNVRSQRLYMPYESSKFDYVIGGQEVRQEQIMSVTMIDQLGTTGLKLALNSNFYINTPFSAIIIVKNQGLQQIIIIFYTNLF